MSAEEWHYNGNNNGLDEFQQDEAYANYVTQWHLNNAKEFVADEAKTELTNTCIRVDKQSIHTAIDNYIEINSLNK